MLYFADLHIHSHYADAVSKYLNLETLYQWAQVKGINVIGTGDFTHPAWFKELQEKLTSNENGFYKLKNLPKESVLPGIKIKDTAISFCLSAEINCEYISGGRLRRVHHLVYAPSFDVALQINQRLSAYGDLAENGRPTVRLSSHNLLEIVMEASPGAFLVPAHVWTPWYSMLGSDCDYNSVDECFGDLSPYIFALETGLSSDPAMNRRCSMLDRFTMMSNSDAHSPQKLGREVNLFSTELGYNAMFEALTTGYGFNGTYEFFPEEGKYSYDGHRNCDVCMSPSETKKNNGICPRCKKALTIGAFNRVEQLSDRAMDNSGDDNKYIVPLAEILSEIHAVSPKSKRVQQAYTKAISTFGNEFMLLHETPVDEIHLYDSILAKAIQQMRMGNAILTPGYDGVYGIVKLLSQQGPATTQLSMFN